MPRSQDLSAYPDFFFELVRTMAEQDLPLRFELPNLQTALDKRNEYYAFLRAMRRETHQRRKRMDELGAHSFANLLSIIASWECVLLPSLSETDDPTIPRQLLFRPKSGKPINRSLLSQLRQQQPTRTPILPDSEAAGSTKALKDFLGE